MMKKADDGNIEKVKAEVEEWMGKYLRALADYQNLEKRVSEQKQDFIKYAAREIITEFLLVLDTLEKTQKHIKDQGLTLAVKKLWDVLVKEGVVKIDVLGKKFDPLEMECVEVVASDKDSEVVEEIRAGYKLGDKVIRVAQVKVGKKVN